MSYDLTLWYAPRLRSFDAAMTRLERTTRQATRELQRLRALLDALRAGPLPAEALSVDPVLDERTATLGLGLTGSGWSLESLLPVAREHGMACYDPQEAVVYYADGTSSREQKAPDGVHEGVPICLAELRQRPPLPASERLDALEALQQFALADSPDEAAAVSLALPALLDLLDDEEPRIRVAARNAAFDLCTELTARGRALALEPAQRQRIEALEDEQLVGAVRAALGG